MHADPHKDLHSEQGALRGEHPGRAADPVIKVRDLAWLDLVKPDLDRAEGFAHDFGFRTVERTPGELRLRGALAGTDCLVIRRGPRSRFAGPVFQAAADADLDRLARATGGGVEELETGGRAVTAFTPSGLRVQVVYGAPEHTALPTQSPLTVNSGGGFPRVNAAQRPERAPALVERLGHVVLASTVFLRDLDWFLEHLGLIVSDFLYLDGQRDRGPVMAFIRCDRGDEPADHHTLALLLSPAAGYVHSAYQVADLDALAAGGEHLKERGHRRSWGIGRHIQGSQIFDYWRDPDRLLVEHFTDGDRFDSSLEPGWDTMTASGLRQWGPPATSDFLGNGPAMLRDAVRALRADNELDLPRILALGKAMSS
ncbi:glyoxalase/bleomycin resistance protein/dioxygenase superfamily protein [Actinocorallia herbida]|uniref:Glyoxalase/bleomycin resistance protein/dioxygenase superfamily protein n=1 Tax=Actinocorallia herbida TaxID=58109 RepID=A0A3N1CZV4_9ACTN|nr:VOC family protein [Actinocorallia herbida]ROO86814.1 glyoxalase/bleomycin resistance protein/dioxygenase superfamily protein [Actinocorallia herbida]